MKSTLVFLCVLFISFGGSSQNKPAKVPQSMPPGMTPEMLEMMKKAMPPGTKLPQELMNMDAEEQGSGAQASQPLIQMSPIQEPPPPGQNQSNQRTDYSPFGSGRNEMQRAAALALVNAELDKKTYALPKPESTPTKGFMLQMASERSKLAHQKFDPDDLWNYSRAVNWEPKFDGKAIDPIKAKEYSLAVAVATNQSNKPYFITAFSAAVFTLDPSSSSNANNLASAILSAGELLHSKSPGTQSLAPFRRDAESGFLYAIAVSMSDSTWGEESFTPLLNLGNLCIDLGKLDEARSLFQVARRINPRSWDAALGLAAYFYAIKQPDKALAVLEDDNLDKPEKYLIAVKSSKSLEKGEKFSDLPLESPDEVYEEGIKIVAAEPILTSADFITQLDQSERNKMRYFIEHLPEAGSYSAPSIKKLSQYASLKAISSPQGVSALEDFGNMLGGFTLSSAASVANQQLEWLAKMGLKIDIKGVDMDDVAKHPEKYIGKDLNPDVTVSGKEEFMAKMQAMGKDAQSAKLDLATGKTASTMELAGKIDPIFNILQMNPDDYADPMNIIMQKVNFGVYNRKTLLYNGYLYALNKRMYRQVSEDISKAQKKIETIAKMREADLAEYEKQRKAAEKAANDAGVEFRSAEWDMRRHNIHTSYFNQFNNAAETGFGSATNVASITYVQKIKPAVEAYYYDVIRHIALISDPDVRNQKEVTLRSTINSNLTWALQTVLMAHGSFSYSEDWDCSCNLEQLIAAREAEQKEIEEEEEAQRERNKEAKARFDSKDIPDFTPLCKRLDSYADEYDFILFKARVSCARTTIEVNENILPFKYKSSENEFTGETQRTVGLKAGVTKKVGGAEVSANVNCDFNFTTDGNGVLKDYSVVPGAEGKVKVGNFSVSAKDSVTLGPEGVRDYSLTGSADASVKYGNTTVKGGASVTINSKGVETDFSAGIKQDLKNDFGGTAKVEMEASTKRGCSLSAEIDHALDPSIQNAVNNIAEKITDGSGISPDLEKYMKKTTWSGKYELKKKQ